MHSSVVWSSGQTQSDKQPRFTLSLQTLALTAMLLNLFSVAKVSYFTSLSWKFLSALLKKKKKAKPNNQTKNIPSWIPRTEINVSWSSRYSTAFARLKGWLIHTLYTYKLFWKEREQYMPGNSQLDSRACWSEQAHAHRSRCLFALSECHVSPTQLISEMRGVVKWLCSIQSDRGIHLNIALLRINSSWRKFQNKMPVRDREREKERERRKF